MLPCFPLLGENSIPQERCKHPRTISKSVVFGMCYWVMFSSGTTNGWPLKLVERTASTFSGRSICQTRGPKSRYWDSIFLGSYSNATVQRNGSSCPFESESQSSFSLSIPRGQWLGSWGGGEQPWYAPKATSALKTQQSVTRWHLILKIILHDILDILLFQNIYNTE